MRKYDIAKIASNLSEHNDYKLGAAIFRKNELVSMGFNSYKTNPRFNYIFSPFKDGAYTLHAEMSAIIKAHCDISGCDIFVWRNYKNGEKANSRPCKFCYVALVESGIRYVYYVTEYGYHRERLN